MNIEKESQEFIDWLRRYPWMMKDWRIAWFAWCARVRRAERMK